MGFCSIIAVVCACLWERSKCILNKGTDMNCMQWFKIPNYFVPYSWKNDEPECSAIRIESISQCTHLLFHIKRMWDTTITGDISIEEALFQV